MKKEMLTFSVALLSAVLSAAAPTDVYLLIGQSNMAGRDGTAMVADPIEFRPKALV